MIWILHQLTLSRMVTPIESNSKEATQSLTFNPLILNLFTIETTIEEETTISKVEIQEEDLQIEMLDKIGEQTNINKPQMPSL